MMKLTRRGWFVAAAATGVALLTERRALAAQGGATTIKVRRNVGCGCCVAWGDHLQEMGFTVDMTEDANLQAYKDALGIPADLQSCHTGVVEGYFIEGHVPGDVIQRLLKEKPETAGLAVPGMPPGSPGMESPNARPFDVYSVSRAGGRQVFARWTPPSG